MTIKECYQALGGNYDNTLARFINEERIQKYIFKFLDDRSFMNLQIALENEELEDAIRAAHTLKGVSENLGFETLLDSSRLILQALRDEDMASVSNLFQRVKEDYQRTIDAIQKFQNK